MLQLKGLLYGRRGEPYKINGITLRYLPGTRPVRLRYVSSPNRNVRDDALQVQLFATALSEGDTAIDIGAHSGQYSMLMATMCGRSGHVVAFEPDPYALQTLRENVRLNPGVKPPIVEPLAIADAAGEATLFSRGGNSQSSLARSGVDFGAGDPPEEIRVPVTCLDDYVSAHQLQPRWIKIDVEGAEIQVLKGARRVLNGKTGVVCELHPYAWPEFGSTLSELKDLASESGRRVRYLDRDEAIGDQAEYGAVLLERLP